MSRMSVTELYDYVAEKFRRDTGYFSPGKSIPPELADCNPPEKQVEIQKLWHYYFKAFNHGADWANEQARAYQEGGHGA